MTPQYILINEFGSKYYHKDKEMTILHREDGPAIEYETGDKCWVVDGKRHRLDGPAVVWADGSRFWWRNDTLHREDGPAVEYADGDKEWWLEGREYTEAEFKKRTAKEITLTMDEIAYKLGIDVSKLKIKK
jgi:hypothetical protein